MRKPIRIIGASLDLGQSRRGVDMGPSALRYAGLTDRLLQLGHTLEDAGNIKVPIRDTLPRVKGDGLKYLPGVVQTCQLLYQAGQKSIADGYLPLFLGGDHSIALGTVGGVTHESPCGLIWIDAHGDFNTPDTSPSGNLHGMPLAALIGHGPPELVDLGRPGPKLRGPDVMIIGVRDLDEQEKTMLRQSGMGIYTMREVDERGIASVAHEALRRLAHHKQLHISLDMDSLDPKDAPGVGTPVPGGLTYREAHLLMEIIADSESVSSVDVVEINPILDEHNRTSEVAMGLLTSLLGKSIL